jgi:hypothetical protein
MRDNEVKLEAVHEAPGIYLMAEENSGKSQLEDHPMKAVKSVIASNNISRISQHVRKEIRKEK